jgi:hypothetical protein
VGVDQCHLGGLADAVDESVEADRADWSAAFGSRNKLSEAVPCRSAEASRTTY